VSLTAPERETVITTSDADGTATIWTAQRPVITKLKNNPAATLIEEGHYGTSVWARFELPAGLVSFRTVRRRMSEEQRAKAAERMRNLRGQS
jgi:hypothetical protein